MPMKPRRILRNDIWQIEHKLMNTIQFKNVKNVENKNQVSLATPSLSI